MRTGDLNKEAQRHQLIACRDFIYRICYRFLRHPEEAQDVAQDVFVLAYGNLHRFRGDSSLKTWLYRISESHCLNRLRKPSPRSLDEETIREVADPVPSGKAVEGMIFHQQLRAAVKQRARTRNPPWDSDDYLIFEVYFGKERKTWSQIAALLGKPIDTVKYHFYNHVLPTLQEVGKEFGAG